MSGGHHHHPPAPPAPVERRAAALEQLLTERGLLAPGYIDSARQVYETQIGPMNGAKVVARAWVDPAFKARLLAQAPRAVAELGINAPEHLHVVENTPSVHNVVVCTLCSCYPWAMLGLPPSWYKDAPYRARVVREPRVLLAEMGCPIDDAVEIHVWDSSADMRYLVLPERPSGTEKLSETELAARVTRDAMIGVARL